MFSEYSLALAIVTDDEDARDDCKTAIENMLSEEISETAVQPSLLAKARALISKR